MSNDKICLVVGAGDDTGMAIAKAFAKESYHVVIVRRPARAERLEAAAAHIQRQGYKATAMPCDARDEKAMAELIYNIETQLGPIEVAVFNIGANVMFNVIDTTPRVYRKIWEMAAYAGFLMAHFVAPHMAKRERGTLIFTGATASMRGGAKFSAFAGAKHALRALAQSCARELGPKNIHVAHVIIDGMIDSNFIRENIPGVDEMRQQDAVLSPDNIAANYVHLHKQPRNAWTFELDLRPYKEHW